MAESAQAVTVEADRPSRRRQLVLQDGTPIKLRLSQTVSSADARTGQEVPFEVVNDILAGGVTVLPAGSKAFAIVTEAEARRNMGRAGKLDIAISYALLSDGERVPLREDNEAKGGSRTEAIASAMTAPFLAFTKSRDVSIPQGTEIMGFVNGDAQLDPGKFGGGSLPVAANAGPIPAALNGPSSLTVDSAPSGADIEVDGKFVGSTPSSVPITIGNHEISVKKKGYATLTRRMDFEGGNVHLNAELEHGN